MSILLYKAKKLALEQKVKTSPDSTQPFESLLDYISLDEFTAEQVCITPLHHSTL